MNRDQTLQLFASGQDAWRSWTTEIQDRRRALEESRKWATDFYGHASNEETRDWFAGATVDFSSSQHPQIFDDDVDLSGCQFPGPTSFAAATFKGIARFARSRFLTFTNFHNVTFSAEADFDDARFSGIHPSEITNPEGANRIPNARFSRNADFSNARFCGPAGFRKAVFERTVWFNDSIFCQDAWFRQVQFAGDAPFFRATFQKAAWFLEAKFDNEAWFERARFYRDVDFSSASFRGGATFDWTMFDMSAVFRAAQCSGAFSFDSTAFGDVPDFIQAHFSEAPHFDNITIKTARRRDARTPSRYRALKRLAIQGHDYAREHEFFVGELKSMRGTVYRLWPNPVNWLRLKMFSVTDRTTQLVWRWKLLNKDDRVMRVPIWTGGATGALNYWVGLLYQWLSNFGRSLVLPVLWWIVSTFSFASLYLRAHYRYADPSLTPTDTFTAVLISWITHLRLPYFSKLTTASASACISGPGDPYWAALGLSIRRGLIFSGIDSSQKIDQIYACLYGTYAFGATSASALSNRLVPVIPDSVSLLGLIQTILSSLLAFLFLLALRNHFRIR